MLQRNLKLDSKREDINERVAYIDGGIHCSGRLVLHKSLHV